MDKSKAVETAKELLTIKAIVDMDKVLSNWLEYKRLTISTPKGINRERGLMKSYFEEITLNQDFNELQYIQALNKLSKKFSVGTMNIIKNMTKNFNKWYFPDYSQRFPNLDKICKRQQPERKYKASDMLTKEDVQKIVQAEHEDYWKAFWLLYFYGGFRPGEVCSLEWKQIKYSSEGAFISIIVIKGNGRPREFTKFIPSDVVFYLKKLENNNSKYVFPTKRKHSHGISVGDTHLTPSGVFQKLVASSPKTLGKKINPYVLRHSIATILYNRDDLKEDDSARQLGHNKAMKETYSHLDEDKIKERAKKIWIKPEDLPEEKKHELEKQIEELKAKDENKNRELKNLQKEIGELRKDLLKIADGLKKK